MGGFKLTVPRQVLAAVYVDLCTLCNAPHDLITAGFGDILAKYT